MQRNISDFDLLQGGDQQKCELLFVSQECSIINNIMRTIVTQRYINKSRVNQHSKSTFQFTKTQGICVESFSASCEDKQIKAVIKEKEQSKQEFKWHQKQGNTVAYSEMNTIGDTQSIRVYLGNLPQDKEIVIELVYSEQLSLILNSFIQVSLPVILFEGKSEEKQAISVELTCLGKITYFYINETTASKVKKIDDNTYSITLSQFQELNFKKCLSIFYSYEGMLQPQIMYGNSQIYFEDIVKQQLMPFHHSIMLTITPNLIEERYEKVQSDIISAIKSTEDGEMTDELKSQLKEEIIATDFNAQMYEYIFLIDRSGSMGGEPIQKAKESLILFLQSLPKQSYFNVVSFGSKFKFLYPSSLVYNQENLLKAINKINTFEADLGETEMLPPLQSILTSKQIQNFPRQLFVLTDGMASNKQKLIQLIERHQKQSLVHAIGFGDCDRSLIKSLASAGNGEYEIIRYEDNLQEAIIRVLQKALEPLIKDISIHYDSDIFYSASSQIDKYSTLSMNEQLTLHLFMKPDVQYDDLTDSQRSITIQYYDLIQRKQFNLLTKLDISDCFRYNKQLQNSIFKIGKQIQLESKQEKRSPQQTLQEAITYQLLTSQTAFMCVIQEASDEKRVEQQDYQKEEKQKKQNSLLAANNYHQNIPKPEFDQKPAINQQIKQQNKISLEDKLKQVQQQIEEQSQVNSKPKQQDQQVSKKNGKNLAISKIIKEQALLRLKNEQAELEKKVEQEEIEQRLYEEEQKKIEEEKKRREYRQAMKQKNKMNQSNLTAFMASAQLPPPKSSNTRQFEKLLNNEEQKNIEDIKQQQEWHLKDQKQVKPACKKVLKDVFGQIIKPEETSCDWEESQDSAQIDSKVEKQQTKIGEEFDYILKKFNFEGFWEYDQLFINKFLVQSEQFNKILTQYNLKVIMTLVIVCLIETKFQDQKQKLILILRKSNVFVSENLKSEEIKLELKQLIKTIII